MYRITPYLDGKTTTDEIMYRTGMTRSQLRDVLRHFHAYVGNFTLLASDKSFDPDRLHSSPCCYIRNTRKRRDSVGMALSHRPPP
jgi:hypothetical protein